MKEHEELYKKAFESGKKRNYRRSLKLFQELVSITDEFPASFLYMGRCCHALGEREKAVRFYRYYLKRFPGSPAGLFFLGRTYLALGLWKKGLSALSQVYRINPDYPQLKAFLGFGFLRHKKIDPAAEFLGLAVEEDPENEKLYQAYLNALYLQGIRYFYREDREMAHQIFSFLTGQGVETVLLFLHMAIIEKENGRYRESLQWYDRALAEQPEDNLIAIQRAEVLYLAGNKDEALRIWNECPGLEGIEEERINPLNLLRLSAFEHYQKSKYRKAFYFATQALKQEKDPNMHLLAAESARNLSDFEVAENHYRRVIEKVPDMLEPRYGLVMLFWQDEEFGKALGELKRMHRIAPEDEVCRYYTTLCLTRTEEPGEESLKRIINEIHQSGPDPWLLTALGNNYSALDSPDLAEKWFRKALIIKKDHRDAFHGLMAVQGLQEASGPLLKSYSEYLKIWKDDRDIRRGYANLLFKEKNFKKALKEIEVLLPYYPGESAINRQLAFCYRECGRFTDAAIIYRQLLKASPEDQVFLRSLIYCLDKGGDRSGAIQILEKAAAFLTPDTGMYLILGVLLFREMRLDDALAVFKKAQEKAKDDWRPLYNIGIIYKEKGLNDYAQTYFARSDRLKKKTEDK